MYREKQATLHCVYSPYKTFGTVSRTGLFKVLEKSGCPSKLLQMMHTFHDRMTARVIFDGDISESFNLRCGVKQGCVMAPNLLGFYLSILFLFAFPSPDRIALHARHDRNLFNLANMRAKTKSYTVLIHELMFAHDLTFCSHSVPKVQEMFNAFIASCNLFSLKVSTKKMVMLATNDQLPCIKINGELLMIVDQFWYLGSMIARTVTLETEVSSQIGKAEHIFGKLT